MRFGIFYEHQLPRPWDAGAEKKLLDDALEQIEIADRVGFDYVWEVEHHFLEEYSHSSAPEVFLAAASQRTERIRLGHGIVQIPPPVNHPARVAERVAMLDLVSDGRVDFGSGEGSSAAELTGFAIDREQKREMWADAIDAITRMFVEEPFAGWESEFIRMPPRNVIPKPLQKPHPPLWVACSRRETIHLAARNGIGALSFSFTEPEDAAKWVDDYYRIIASPECVPAGFAVNANLTVVLPMMVHPNEQTAIERGVDGGHFFGYSLSHYFGLNDHAPGSTNVHELFVEGRDQAGFARGLIEAADRPLSVKLLEEGLGSMRGAIGTPAQVEELVRRYEAAGVDQVVFVMQAGNNRHEHICESLELFGEEVIPAFAAEVEEKERAKAERLAPAVEAALARREPARAAPPGYVIDEQAELERYGRPVLRAPVPGEPRPPLRERLRGERRRLERRLRRRGEVVFASLVRGRTDAQLERRFGSAFAQRVLFEGMARQFRPDKSFGFEGDVVYELRYPTNGSGPDHWTVSVRGERATARRGASPNAALTVKIGIPDFMRIAAGEIEPQRPLMQGRLDFEGDLTVALRLGEMFGQRSQF